jgi:hypothetical protein
VETSKKDLYLSDLMGFKSRWRLLELHMTSTHHEWAPLFFIHCGFWRPFSLFDSYLENRLTQLCLDFLLTHFMCL